MKGRKILRSWIYVAFVVVASLTTAMIPSPALTQPQAPSSLTAIEAPYPYSKINLGWSDNSTNESGFKVERATSSNGPWSQIAAVNPNVTSYLDSGLGPSTTYYYRVRAYNKSGSSGYSNTASATTCPSTVDCAQGLRDRCDVDGDGISDYDECTGLSKQRTGYITIQRCAPICEPPNCDRQSCLDPNTKDLFLILVKAGANVCSYVTPNSNCTFFPPNPTELLQYISKAVPEGGLALIVHVDPANAGDDRQITFTQKAVKVTESLDASEGGIDLGSANYGTPNSYDLATIYTERIKNYVNTVCAGASAPIDENCKDVDGITVGPENLIKKYIRHTIAHEIGHMIALTTQNVSSLGGHHYTPGSNVIMEQSVSYTTTTKGGTTTIKFYISDDYVNPEDTQGFLLR